MKDGKHTHRGTCQVCGAQQAVNNVTGYIAKHGYTVKHYGFFNGTCTGSDKQPLEVSRYVTDNTIAWLRERVALAADMRAVDLASGAVEPRWTKMGERNPRTFERARIACDKSELTTYDQDSQLRSAIYAAQQEARHARAHARDLTQLIADRHGKALTPVVRADKPKVAVGAVVKAYGKEATVVGIETRECRGCGPNLNGQHIPHAVLQYEGLQGRKTIYVPVRLIRTVIRGA